MITRNVIKPGSFRKITTSDRVEYEYTRTVTVNNAKDNEDVIAKALPRQGGRFSWRNKAVVCDETEISRVDRLVWAARIRFSQVQATRFSPAIPVAPKPKNPLEWPVEIAWRNNLIDWWPPTDANGKPYLNSAGDPLKDVPPTQITHPILTMTRHQQKFVPGDMLRFANKLNSRSWFGIPAKAALCLFPDATLSWVEAAGGYVWRVTYMFEVALEGWDTKLADFGKRQLVEGTFLSMDGTIKPSGTDIPVSLKDEHGQPLPDGDFLDGAGKQLPFGPGREKKIKYLYFQKYPRMDFHLLRLV